MKISKRKLSLINNASLFSNVIKKKGGRSIGGSLWIDCPPDMWNKEEVELFDIMVEHEMEIKKEIIEILTNTP